MRWNPFKMNNDKKSTTGAGQAPIQPNPSLISPGQQGLNQDIGPPPRIGDSGGVTGGTGKDDGFLGPPIPGGGADDNLRTGGGLPLPGKQGGTTGNSGDNVNANIYPGPGDGTWSGGRPPGDVWIQDGANDSSRYVGPPATIRDNNPLPPPPNRGFSGPGGSTTTSFSSTSTNATLGNTGSGQTAGTSGPTTISGAENRKQNTLDDQGSNPFGGFNSASGNKSTDV